MNTTSSIGRRASRLAMLTVAAVAAFLATTSVHARSHSTSGSGPRGSFSRQVDRSAGSVARSSTVTNAAGKSASHTYNRTVDRATGSVNAMASTTLPDGRTASRSLTSTKTDDGRTTTRTVTRPKSNP